MFCVVKICVTVVAGLYIVSLSFLTIGHREILGNDLSVCTQNNVQQDNSAKRYLGYLRTESKWQYLSFLSKITLEDSIVGH